MVNIVKDNWAIFTTLISGIIWAIVRGEKIKNLDMRVSVLEEEDNISRQACKDIRTDCKAHFTSEIKHSGNTLDHLSKQFDIYEKRSEERHSMVMAQLLKSAGNKQN